MIYFLCFHFKSLVLCSLTNLCFEGLTLITSGEGFQTSYPCQEGYPVEGDHLEAYRREAFHREAFRLEAFPNEEVNRREAYHLGAYLDEVEDFLEEAASSW